MTSTTKKAPSTRIFNTTHGAFISPIVLPGELYGVLIEFDVIRNPYTLDGYRLSKAGTFQPGPMREPTYIGVEAGGEGFKIVTKDL